MSPWGGYVSLDNVLRNICDPEDILLIYPDISITLPGNLLFSEIYTYVSNKYMEHWIRRNGIH